MFSNYNPSYNNIQKRSIKHKNKTDITSSKLENFFEVTVLRPLNIKYITQKKVANKYYDFYIPKYNLLIEVDGDYFHAKNRDKKLNAIQKKNIMNDHKKNSIAKGKGYKLIRFWESDIKNNTLLVIKKLKEELSKPK